MTPHVHPTLGAVYNKMTAHGLAMALFAIAVLFGCGRDASQTDEATRNKPATARQAPSTPSVAARFNRPPVIRSARIVPNPVLRSGPVTVQVEAEDPDLNAVTFRHQWLANGELLAGETGPTVPPHRLRRGDLVAVEVTPLDGLAEGAPYRTEAVPVENSPPEVTRLLLQPDPVRVGDRLRAQTEASDADGDSIEYTFRWWRNNALLVEGEADTLDTGELTRGDTIVAQVTPRDSASAGKPVFSQEITIANSPPKITSVPPAAFQPGRYEYLVTARDPDGDPLAYGLPTAPPGMTMDKTRGRIEWRLAPGTMGTHKVKVSVEDGQGGRTFQEFDLTLPGPAPAS